MRGFIRFSVEARGSRGLARPTWRVGLRSVVKGGDLRTAEAARGLELRPLPLPGAHTPAAG